MAQSFLMTSLRFVSYQFDNLQDHQFLDKCALRNP